MRVLGAEGGEEGGWFGEGEGDEEMFFCWTAAHCCCLMLGVVLDVLLFFLGFVRDC